MVVTDAVWTHVVKAGFDERGKRGGGCGFISEGKECREEEGEKREQDEGVKSAFGAVHHGSLLLWNVRISSSRFARGRWGGGTRM